MKTIRFEYGVIPEEGVSDLQENVLLLLEAACIPAAVNDQIIKLIEAAEREQREQYWDLQGDEA